jgi:hypothetical protein
MASRNNGVSICPDRNQKVMARDSSGRTIPFKMTFIEKRVIVGNNGDSNRIGNEEVIICRECKESYLWRLGRDWAECPHCGKGVMEECDE